MPASCDEAFSRYLHDEMNSSFNSTSAQRSPISPFARTLSRRWSSLSSAEQGDDVAVAVENEAIEQEIDEIKRYEVRNVGNFLGDAAC